MNAIKAIPEREAYGVERIEGGMIVTHYDPSRVKKFRQSSFFFKMMILWESQILTRS